MALVESKSSNPVLSEKIWQKNRAFMTSGNVMTLNGTINKALVSLLILILSAAWAWSVVNEQTMVWLMAGGGIGGFVIALVTVFRSHWAPFTVPFYALAEGLFVGAISALMESKYPGIVTQAVLLTFGIFAVMLTLYRTGTIKVTQKLRSILIASILGIMSAYLISWIMSLFGVVPFIWGNSWFSIGFSLFVVGIASFTLLLDFDDIEKNVQRGAPKYMEWFGAFGLMVTLIWLYVEILRLLSKISSRE